MLLALALIFSLIPASVVFASETDGDNIETEANSNEEREWLIDEDCEYYTATPIRPSSAPMKLRAAPSTTTVGINISAFPGYTNTATGAQMSYHFIRDSSGNLENTAWCIEPGALVVNGDSYALDNILSNQTLKDVLQIAYEWGWWSNASYYPSKVAATQIAVWWALGYSSASCSVSGVDSDASTLYNAALADYGCGGGDLYAYECTTNSSHQRLATYYPYRYTPPAPQIEYGDIRIIKTSANPDITNGSDCYSLQGAVYGIYSSKSNAQNDRNRLDTLTTNANGNTGYSNNLEAGYTYFVKEITAPKGYALDTTVHSVTVTANRTATLNLTDEPQNDPISVILKKVDAYTGQEYAQGNAKLEGAEYTVRFYDGQYATAAEAEASGSPTRSWVLRTDEDGYCYLDTPWLVSGDPFYYHGGYVTLPIGTVLIQETKAPEGYFINDQVYVVHITENGNDQATIGAYNAPVTPEYVLQGNIQIIKTTRTGRDQHAVMEDGAVFEIYLKSAGSYAAAAATDKALVTTDANGIAFAADLPYGTYTVHQVSGWPGSKLAPDFDVTINTHGQTYTYDIENERFYSEVQIVKVDAVTGDPIPVAGVGFQIKYPDGTIYDFAGTDTWYTDSNGTLTLPEALEYGEDYMAIELNAPAGYVTPNAPFMFDVTEAAATMAGGSPLVIVEIENQPTQVDLVKEDNGGRFLSGARMQLLDVNGDVVDEWVSGAAAHTIYALSIGESYTLREVEAPAGYVLANDVTFTVADTTGAQTITLVDKQVRVVKTDVLGTPISGAVLQILDAQDTVVEEWTSTDKPYAVSGLVAGQTYKLHEKTTPDGFVGAKDITFTVTTTSETQVITMIDKQVLVEKVDTEDAPLSGAKLQVLDAAGTVIDEWVSGTVAQAVTGLALGGTYTLREVTAPDGYAKANDITFTVTNDDETQTITMVNKQVKVTKTDAEGTALSGAKLQILDSAGAKVDEWTSDSSAHAVKGLIVGQTYTLREASAPAGYALAKDSTFTVTDDGKVQSITLVNKQVNITKTDAEGATLSGAKLQILDSAGAKVDEWTSDSSAHAVKGLIVGQTYTIHEESAPADYALTKDSTFTVTDDGKNQAISVVNKKVAIEKVDPYGNPFSGATIQILDKDGNKLDEWTTDGTAHIVKGLKEGQTYTIHETEAPDGWLLAPDTTFTVSDDDKNQTVKFENEEKPVIKTTATVDDRHDALAKKDVTLKDVVSYEKLIPGREYVVKGKLMDKATGKALLDKDGKEITSSVTFKPTASTGTVELTFTYTPVPGSSTVVFEDLYRNNRLICTHADINDADQTVTYPSIKTKATIGEKKEAYRTGSTMKITDVIEYSGLTVGKTYTVKGTLVDKKDGKALTLRGTETQITAETTFTPTESSGSVTVEFELPTNVITKTTEVVVYEEIYDADYLIAEHEDVNDADQTVKIRIYVPYNPQPEVESPDSGDAGIAHLLVLAVVAVLGIGVLFYSRYRIATNKKQK